MTPTTEIPKEVTAAPASGMDRNPGKTMTTKKKSQKQLVWTDFRGNNLCSIETGVLKKKAEFPLN